MSDIHAHTEIRMGSEKNFGLVIGSVFLLLTLIGLFYGGWYWPFALVVSAVLYGLAFLAPDLLRTPNRLWFRFGTLLHSIISPVVMFLVFAVTFIPIGMIFRLRGKDLLDRKVDPSRPSYWVERTEQPGSMTRQF